MKKVFVLGVQPDPEGPTFGRVMDPEDFQKSQDYAHSHIEQVVRDLLVAGATNAQVAGFQATVAGGLTVSVAKGTVVDALGVSYESPDLASVVAMAAAHVTLPRIDLIYASLEIDAQAGSEFRPYRQLRTQAELESGLPPYLPTQFNQPTELHTRATIGVKTGVASGAPVAPVAGANEVALWQVHVSAGQTVLVGGDLTSVRVFMKSLYQALLDIVVLQAQMAVLPETVQDIVGVFLSSPDGSLTVTYNDAGNVETVILAAPYKALLDGATNLNNGSTLVKRDASGNFKAGIIDVNPAQPTPGVGTSITRAGLCLLAPTNDLTALLHLQQVSTGGIKFAVDDEVGQNTPRLYIFQARGSNDELRWHIDGFGQTFIYGSLDISPGGVGGFGDLSITGNLSKGSGTFLIDHPLDPDNKDLIHGFVEAPRYDLFYRGRVQLVAGQATVDIDAASGMTTGTFVALCQNVQFLPPYAETDWDKVRVQPGSLGSDATFIIECENPASTAWVSWALMAERKDAMINAIDGTDANGKLIVERDKAAPDMDLLEDQIRMIEGAPSETLQEVVSALIGKQGFRRHAAVTGVGTIPMRDVHINPE